MEVLKKRTGQKGKGVMMTATAVPVMTTVAQGQDLTPVQDPEVTVFHLKRRSGPTPLHVAIRKTNMVNMMTSTTRKNAPAASGKGVIAPEVSPSRQYVIFQSPKSIKRKGGLLHPLKRLTALASTEMDTVIQALATVMINIGDNIDMLPNLGCLTTGNVQTNTMI